MFLNKKMELSHFKIVGWLHFSLYKYDLRSPRLRFRGVFILCGKRAEIEDFEGVYGNL